MVCQYVAEDACAALAAKLRPDSHDENQYLSIFHHPVVDGQINLSQ